MTRGQVAGAERRAKEREPDRFCRFRDCLYRLATFEQKITGFCPKHEPESHKSPTP